MKMYLTTLPSAADLNPRAAPHADADSAICPSEWVRDDLVRNFGFPSERTAIVPYGVNPELFSVRNEPVRGRILFAGTAELRKGIHYLAAAAEKLLERRLRCEFRVAGNVERVSCKPGTMSSPEIPWPHPTRDDNR